MTEQCCIPDDIVRCSLRDILDKKTAARVHCSNPRCLQSGLVHQGCFYKWEDMLVSYLLQQEERDVDAKVLERLLWTREMWELPLPRQLIQCKCGEGELKGLVENDEMNERNDFPDNENPRSVTLQELGGGDGDDHDEVKILKGNNKVLPVENNTDEGRWEVVTRCKVKKKSPVKNTAKKQQRKSSTKKPIVRSYKLPEAGPDPDPGKKPNITSTKSGNPEGRRDSSGLIHCCSCKTVHSSLPDFIKHCKSSQHNNQMLGDFNNNENIEEDVLEVKREVNNLKKGLIEVMKQGLEKDITSTIEMEQFKERCETELKKGSSVLALLIEKFQAMEDNIVMMQDSIVKMEEKITSLSALVKSNEEEIDSHSHFIHGNGLTKCTENTEIEKKRKGLSHVDEEVFEDYIDENRESIRLSEINAKLAVLALLLTGVFYLIAFGLM